MNVFRGLISIPVYQCYEIGQERPDNISIPKDLPEFPKYEYEPRFFKRQNRGLYGGLQRKRSKSCSEYLNKTLRAHRPNVQWTKLWSETLNRDYVYVLPPEY
ncbi:Ribosomal L28 family protein [Candida albicans]|uniref:Ribosomal L28 family protein n=1 Tax=Candida albicans TaxID=5476 RepID=A0A8H6BWT2_CANAX|nr:Ribosomal L28 family protein [Candida albicans]